jgi:hypothetical protein
LIKDEQLAEYRISIEADSMAAMDWAAERDAAVQFMQGLGAFISQVSPMAQAVPGAAPYLLRLLQWSVSKFRVSGEIEGILDQAIAQMQNAGMQPPQPSPLQQAEVAEKMAGAEERKAKALNTRMEAEQKVLQLNAMRTPMTQAAMQPNPALPPIAPGA